MGFIRDYAETRAFTLGQPMQPTPLEDDRTVLFLRAEPRQAQASLWSFDVETGETKQVLTPGTVEESLSGQERARRERLRLTIGGFTGFTVAGDRILLPVAGRAVIFDRKTQKTTWLPPCVDPQLSPDGNKVGYVRDFDLHIFENDVETRVTFGGTSDDAHGIAEFVAQEEMHRMHGFWWSPDSQNIAYTRVEQGHVELFRIADPLHPENEPQTFRYPRAGKDNARVQLFTRDGEVTWDQTAFPYLARVVWQEHGPLTFLVQARDQRRQQLRTIDKLLLEETDPSWLNIDATMPKWTPQGFLWTTERDGWWSLELHGDRVTTLLPPAAKLHQVVRVTAEHVYFLQARTSIDLALCRVPLTGGEWIVLSESAGERSVSFGQSNKTFVETVATPSEWRKSFVASRELPSVNERSPLVPRIEWKRVDQLDAVVITPTQFDASKRYPVVLSVYGGPHHKMVLGARDSFLREQWIAEAGCIVVAADNRGTPRRGRDFERAIAGDFSRIPLDDQIQALHGVATPQMDLTRVGVIGWSFGGYMAALAVLKRPDVFHVAVAGAPVVDWRSYDTHYTERYLGTDLATYQQSSLLPYAPALSRPLLLVHGTADDNVYFMHTLQLADALFKAGRPFDLLPLPGATHMVPPQSAEALWERMRSYLLDRLSTSRQT